jgi:hypothetical protein
MRKITKAKKGEAGNRAQVVEYLPNKCQALDSTQASQEKKN